MIFAISTDSPAIPPNPSTAATSAMIRNVKAQPSMMALLTTHAALKAASRGKRLRAAIVPAAGRRSGAAQPDGRRNRDQDHGAQRERQECGLRIAGEVPDEPAEHRRDHGE